MQIQPAVKKETTRIAAGTAAGTAVMFLVFFGLHLILPDSVPFDYKVILGGAGGGLVAVANFFLMGITVQKVTSVTDDKLAFDYMKASYRNRITLQLLWIVAALVLPCFNGAAGVVPLFIPSLYIKGMNILGMASQNKTERR